MNSPQHSLLHACLLALMLAASLVAPLRVLAADVPGIPVTHDKNSFGQYYEAYSPNGLYLIFDHLTHDGDQVWHQLWLANSDGSNPRAISRLGWQYAVKWAPDSSAITFMQNDQNSQTMTLYLYDLASEQTRSMEANLSNVSSCAVLWAPDAKHFLLNRLKVSTNTDQRYGLYLYEVTSAKCTELCPNNYSNGSAADQGAASWSPDGSHILWWASSTNDSAIRLWVSDADGGNARPITPVEWLQSLYPHWSPDGQDIAFATLAGRSEDEKNMGMIDLWLVHADGSDAHALTHGSDPDTAKRRSYMPICWTSDRRYIICQISHFDHEGNYYGGYGAVDAKTGEIVPILSNDQNATVQYTFFSSPNTSPDGSKIAFAVQQKPFSHAVATVASDRHDILYCFDLTTRTLTQLDTSSPDLDKFRLEFRTYWSPDSTKILTTKAKIVSVESGKYDYDLMVYPSGTPAVTAAPAKPVSSTVTAATPAVTMPATATPKPATSLTDTSSIETAKAVFAAKAPEIVRLRNRKVDDLAKALPAAYKSIYTIDNSLNAFIVTAPDEDTFHAFQRDVGVLDQSTLVMVDVLVTELTKDASRQLGLNWQATGNLAFSLPTEPDGSAGQVIYQGVGHLDQKFFVTLSALEEQGKAQVRANPRILALSGTPANIDIIKTHNFFYVAGIDSQGNPYQTRSDITAEINLKIQPQVYADNRIALTMDATVDSFVFGTQNNLPDTTRRQAVSTIVLDSGQTLIIGGLTEMEEANIVDKTPILGDLPLLGQLFRRTKKSCTENTIVIFVNPHIVDANALTCSPFGQPAPADPPAGMTNAGGKATSR